jgi:hypothetical protein
MLANICLFWAFRKEKAKRNQKNELKMNNFDPGLNL